MSERLEINTSEEEPYELNLILRNNGFSGSKSNREKLRNSIKEESKDEIDYNKWKTQKEKDEFIDKAINPILKDLEKVKK